MKRTAIFLAASLISVGAFASAGTTGAASLKLGAGARGQGMADAFAATASGAESLFWNPAGMASGSDRSIMLGFQPMLGNASVSQAAASARFGRLGLGLGFSSLKQDTLDGLDEVGNRTGSFQAQDQTLVAGASLGGPRAAAGITAKYWRSQIDGQSATALAADLGLGFASPLTSRMRHAIVIRHLGGAVSYVSQQDPLPTTGVFGTSYRFSAPVTAELDVAWERAQGAYGSAGLEWGVIRSSVTSLNLRSGYTNRRNAIGGLSGAAFGLGVSYRTFSFDYAWIPFGDLGDAHAFTLTWRPSVTHDPAIKQRRHEARQRKLDQNAKGKMNSSPTGRRQLQDLAAPRKKD